MPSHPANIAAQLAPGSGAPNPEPAIGRQDDPLLPPRLAGEYLGAGERMARRLIANREVAVVRVGRHVRIRRSELDRYLAEHTTPAGFGDAA